jgi:(R,R)-butanediol dehydrogenase/meso-butanediol dehydrogenase/diacetyl reductase
MPLSIQDIEKPEIADDEMLVRVSHCGICGTDIHASREGPFMAPPNTVFGHEFSGEIVELGAALNEGAFTVGDRVTSLPFIKEQTIGLGAVTGAYAEFVKVDPASVVRIPSELDDLNGTLVEPLAVGLHSVKMAEGVDEKRVLIIGAGPIGLACAIWCRFFGARNVVISEMSPARIRMANTLGFNDIVDPSEDVQAQFAAITAGEPEVQFDCVGAPGILQQCIERAPKRGLIMGIGLCDHPDNIMPLLAFSKELRIQWAVAYDKEDWDFTIRMMIDKRIDGSPMITNVVTLEELPEAFEALRSPTDQCKVIIDLRG